LIGQLIFNVSYRTERLGARKILFVTTDGPQKRCLFAAVGSGASTSINVKEIE